MELETDSVRVSVALLNGVLQVVLGNDTPVVASTTSEDNVWNHIVVTLENTTTPSQDSLNISIYINGTLDGTPVISLGTFPASLQSVSIGDGYTGSLKDVGLYSPALNEADLEPAPADFISQCLCYPGTISTTDPALCTGNTENNRYVYYWYADYSGLLLYTSSVIVEDEFEIHGSHHRVNVDMNSDLNDSVS